MKNTKLIALLAAATLLAACGKGKNDKPVSSAEEPTTSETVTSETPATSEKVTSEAPVTSEKTSSETKTSEVVSSSNKTSSSETKETADFNQEYTKFLALRGKMFDISVGSPFTVDTGFNVVQEMEMSGMKQSMVESSYSYVSTDGKNNYYKIGTEKHPNSSGKLVVESSEEFVDTAEDGTQTFYSFDEGRTTDPARYRPLSKGHIENSYSLEEVVYDIELPFFDPSLGITGGDNDGIPSTWADLSECLLENLAGISEMLDESYIMPLFTSHYEEQKSAVKDNYLSLQFDCHYQGIGSTESKGSVEGVKDAKYDVVYTFEAHYSKDQLISCKAALAADFDIKGLKTDYKMHVEEGLESKFSMTYDDEYKPSKKDVTYVLSEKNGVVRMKTPNDTLLFSQDASVGQTAPAKLPYAQLEGTEFFLDKEMTKPVTEFEYKSYPMTYYCEPKAKNANEVVVIAEHFGRNTASDKYSIRVGNNGGTLYGTREAAEDGRIDYATWDYNHWENGVYLTDKFHVDNVEIQETNDPNAKWENGVLYAKRGSYVIASVYGTKI